jgi:putative transposase
VFRAEGIRIMRTPIRAPNANAVAERWVSIVRTECLDWILVFSRRHLERVLRTYISRYNEHRPHRSLDLRPPDARGVGASLDASGAQHIQRGDVLGGLMHEYEAVA